MNKHERNDGELPMELVKRALRKMERWILEHQEPDGCWGGIQPPWVYSPPSQSRILPKPRA